MTSRYIRNRLELLYLPPYSPDFNPIKEFFAEMKAFIKRNWKLYVDLPQDFGEFLEWCVNTIGVRKPSAKGYFRHAGISIKEL